MCVNVRDLGMCVTLYKNKNYAALVLSIIELNPIEFIDPKII